LFKEMIKHNIKKYWVANATTAALMNLDEEFYNFARKAGCVEWFIGFESINQAALNHVKKKQNKTKDFQRLVKRLHDHGMAVQAGIIFGFDEDTPAIFDNTLDKLYEYEIDVLEVNILTPYPGTPLFKRLDEEGRILTKDWSKYNQVDVVFQPKNMTVDQLYQGTKKVAKKFYSWKQILNREVSILKTNQNIGVIFPLGNNITFRRYYFNEYKL
ncbi:MAG: radical SAM protein, partial [Candidatus Thermoplasmatota archaeon]|nr:radical SAM protein [Candidatus Thermoplasmatota archaeon]